MKVLTSEEVFQAVKERALPLIEAYHDDVHVHDLRAIAENPGAPFLHFTGACGTHIVFLYQAGDYPAAGKKVPHVFGESGRDHILGEIPGLVRGMPGWGRDRLVLYFNGFTVRQISQARAESIATDYRDRVAAEWRREDERSARKRRAFESRWATA